MYLLAFKIFLRNKATYWSIALLLVTGIASIHIGKKFVEKQTHMIEKTAQIQKDHIKKHVGFFNKEMGLLMYYLRFSVVNQPPMLSAIAIGQRDINPAVTGVTIRNLNEQIYDTDLNNPSSLLLGNLDLNFVFIYLFPLIIIVFCYNIVSEEREKGIWGLTKIQSKSVMQVIWMQFSIRMLVIYGVAILLIAFAAIYLPLPVNKPLVASIILLFAYLLFWFAIAFLIVSFGKTSNYNTITLLTVWITLNIIGPAFLNLWVTNKYNMPEALETVIHQREGYHEKWDIEKQVTMNKFYAHYPQFKAYVLPKKEFSWLWYYAMQQMGDDDAQQSADQMLQKTIKREQFTQRASLFMPSLYAQLQLNEFAQSDLNNHLHYLQSVKKYHEKLRLDFYPLIFGEKPVNSINWNAFEMKRFTETSSIGLTQTVLPLLLYTFLFGILGLFFMKKTLFKL
ncbi:DUF3526 domain-containing protein [Pedobacter sp. Hv1]|uniref:DUF3526 domain-containing protein n=1 Tax=Pedobacter sp. Hv1 TaxID=1740090 RepID=UPI0006D8B060|nr:DUF3526 domain-containing protein [Pedobacter sp. Hv1]KQC02244.1 ABC transporter permease [Pedobacter sp. Hv1]